MKSGLKGWERGFTLVEVLIVASIMVIVLFAVANYMMSLQRTTRSISEKLAALDLEKTLQLALSDGSTCAHVLNNPHSLTFDATALSASNSQRLTPSLPLYAKVSGGVPGPVVASVGSSYSPLAQSLVVKSIDIVVTSGSSGTYLGNWEIAFDSTKTVIPLKPVVVSTVLNVDDSVPTASKILGCNNGGSSGGAPAPPLAGNAQIGNLVMSTTTANGDYNNAWAYCLGLNQGGKSWRLPTSEEIETIRHQDPVTFDSQFPNGPGNTAYWTSTPYTWGANAFNAWHARPGTYSQCVVGNQATISNCGHINHTMTVRCVATVP